MNLTKTQKTFVGILHFAPIIGIFLYMVAFLDSLLRQFQKWKSITENHQ
jgi:hypothetical protein